MLKKGGQVTIFIIIAIAIVALVLLFFILRERFVPEKKGVSAEENPQGFIASCINPKISEIADVIAKQGGTYDLSGNDSLALTIDGQRMAYLCFTTNYYYPCINQQPMLLEHIKDELKEAMKNDVKKCFDSMEQELERKNYVVSVQRRDYSTTLAPKSILIDYDYVLTISKAGATQRFDNFKTMLRNPLYDLAVVAQEIASQEAKYCNFETVGFGLLYSEFSVSRFRTGDLKTLYQINHKSSGKEFNFAIRGCVIPPGI